jgi:hypothetical protein
VGTGSAKPAQEFVQVGVENLRICCRHFVYLSSFWARLICKPIPLPWCVIRESYKQHLRRSLRSFFPLLRVERKTGNLIRPGDLSVSGSRHEMAELRLNRGKTHAGNTLFIGAKL